MLEIYVDGSCYGNPGPGGFGIAVYENKKLIKAYSKQFNKTTNNQMELLAILSALVLYGQEAEIAKVYSDSAYAINTYTSWMFNWSANDWKKKDGNTPENLEIIKEYYHLLSLGYQIELIKVKGHSGIEENEFVDKLAKGIL